MPTQKAIAVISDIHSNLEALTAVLKDLKSQGITKIVCLGDIVGYAADPQHCLEKIRTLGCSVVMGNHDEAACLDNHSDYFNANAHAGVVFSAAQLTENDKSWLLSLPRDLIIGDTTFLHASLDCPEDWNYILSEEDAEAHFSYQATQFAFCGQSHATLLWVSISPQSLHSNFTGEGIISLPEFGKTLVNVGSVGQPRDGDNRACYVIYRPDQSSVEYRRVSYPIEITRQKILKADLPPFTADRLLRGR